jgi:hypothetical protein
MWPCLHQNGSLSVFSFVLRPISGIVRPWPEWQGNHGIRWINVPALGFNFTDREPIGWIDAPLTARSGEFTVRAIGGNRRLDGYVKRLTWRT